MSGRGPGSGGGWAPRRSLGPFASRPPRARRRRIGVGRIVLLGAAAISLYLVAPSVLEVFATNRSVVTDICRGPVYADPSGSSARRGPTTPPPGG
jgi:hypothetical protein